MDIPQNNVLQLTDRVDVLYQMLEQINEKITHLLSLQSTREHQSGLKFGVSPPRRRSACVEAEASSEHKDILSDGPLFDIEQMGYRQTLSPELQIQRLTAQLTAAYNRIAALEEQLLTHRVH
jgi:hypothetical protein